MVSRFAAVDCRIYKQRLMTKTGRTAQIAGGSEIV
jgi:hypothetical protein